MRSGLTKLVTEKDLGWNKIKKNLAKIGNNGIAVSVGWQGSEAGQDHEGMTNVELASIHEFGSSDGTIPERRLFRKTLEKHNDKYVKEETEIVKKLLEGQNVDGLLLLLGEMFKADIFDTVNSKDLEPWAESTLAEKTRKGKQGDPVLRDTNQLLDSISHEIVKANSKK